jgi:hypothetical protein
MEKWINAHSLENLSKEMDAHHRKEPTTPAETAAYFAEHDELYARLLLHADVMGIRDSLDDHFSRDQRTK